MAIYAKDEVLLLCLRKSILEQYKMEKISKHICRIPYNWLSCMEVIWKPDMQDQTFVLPLCTSTARHLSSCGFKVGSAPGTTYLGGSCMDLG